LETLHDNLRLKYVVTVADFCNTAVFVTIKEAENEARSRSFRKIFKQCDNSRMRTEIDIQFRRYTICSVRSAIVETSQNDIM